MTLEWADQKTIREVIESQLKLKAEGVRSRERPMGVVTTFVSKTGMVMKVCEGHTRAGNASGTRKGDLSTGF